MCVQADKQEAAAAYEVQLESLKVEVQQLRGQCRRMETQSDMADIFDKYERQIKLLLDEGASLREENQLLHVKVARVRALCLG